MEKNKVMELVVETLAEVLEDMGDFDSSKKPTLSGSSRLIGSHSLLSSIELVSLIVGIEQKLADEHEIFITVADERAMSFERSPFRTVESLTDYVVMVISELDQDGR